jgi:hypothetical protein
VEQAIEKNCQLETRVNDDIRARFLRNILERFAETGNPRDAIQNAVATNLNNPDPLLLKGPEVRINLPVKFGRLVPYTSIRNNYSILDGSETLDEQKKKENDVEFGRQKIDPQNLLDKLYSNCYGFIWATDAESIDSNLGVDELRCRLGLPYLEGTLLLKMVYSRDVVHKRRLRCLFPTVVEGHITLLFNQRILMKIPVTHAI